MTTLAVEHTLGKPQKAGPLAVYPVFGPPARLRYAGLEFALGAGAFVRELDGGASVREVVIENPTGHPVLIYEGQQISGAQQNRSIDVSILVPAKSAMTVPVSCIEQGRWEGARHGEAFRVSSNTGDPRLRAVKRETAQRPGAEGRPDQSRVWAEVGQRLAASGVASDTQSLEDLFAMRGHRLEELGRPLHVLPGQVGTVAAISGRPVALDLVSRSAVFSEVAPALMRGYALQAADAEYAKPDHDRAARFLAKALAARRELSPNAGLGHAFRFSRRRSFGAGLAYDGELIALSAFPRDSVVS